MSAYDSPAQQSLLAISCPYPTLVWRLRTAVFPNCEPNHPPSDRLTHQTTSVLLTDSPARGRLTRGIYIIKKLDHPTGRTEVTFKAALSAAPVEAKSRYAQPQDQLPKADITAIFEEAFTKGFIRPEEADFLEVADQARFRGDH